jgi:hypothetical protein
VHQKEVDRISELFDNTKDELVRTGRELKEIAVTDRILQERVHRFENFC